MGQSFAKTLASSSCLWKETKSLLVTLIFNTEGKKKANRTNYN